MSVKIQNNGQWVTPKPSSIEDFAKSYVEHHVPEALKKSAEQTLFRRFEDKYILPKSLKSDLNKVLAKHLNPDYPDKKTKYNVMRSVYFDSKNLDMVKHHVEKADSRFKLRTREYAPDGNLAKSDYMYLEVKAKHGDVCDKFRIKVPKSDVESFKKGLPIIPTAQLIKANPNIGVVDLVKRVMDINSAMTKFELRPSCEVRYTRRAYSDGAVDDGLRVTFDEGVNHTILDVIPTSLSNALNKDSGEDSLSHMVNGYSPDSHLILEVKHHGTIPDWLTQFLNDHKVIKTQFSKYVFSMAQHAVK